jgi:hypothetical protein
MMNGELGIVSWVLEHGWVASFFGIGYCGLTIIVLRIRYCTACVRDHQGSGPNFNVGQARFSLILGV